MSVVTYVPDGVEPCLQWMVNTEDLERARKFWAEIAQKHGWYSEPFHVQLFVDEFGAVIDHVSTVGLSRDIAVRG